MSDQKTKNKMIGDRGSLTRQKRKNQNCHTHQLKIVNSHLTSSQKEYLKKSFIESKWEPTTQMCPNCGYEEDRDIHAAKNMILIGSKMYNRAGTARIDACGDE